VLALSGVAGSSRAGALFGGNTEGGCHGLGLGRCRAVGLGAVPSRQPDRHAPHSGQLISLPLLQTNLVVALHI